MKRKGVRVMVGLVLICLLTGMLGVYSASAWNTIGLTYRRPMDNWGGSGGVKIYTQSDFGGELLIDYENYTYEDYYRSTYVEFQSSVLYRFKGSSDTSPYVGIGYFSSTDTYENWGTELWKESGFALLIGMERFFGEKFSADLRATLYFNTWKDVWDDYWEDHGTRSGFYIDMGISMYR